MFSLPLLITVIYYLDACIFKAIIVQTHSIFRHFKGTKEVISCLKTNYFLPQILVTVSPMLKFKVLLKVYCNGKLGALEMDSGFNPNSATAVWPWTNYQPSKFQFTWLSNEDNKTFLVGSLLKGVYKTLKVHRLCKVALSHPVPFSCSSAVWHSSGKFLPWLYRLHRRLRAGGWLLTLPFFYLF